ILLYPNITELAAFIASGAENDLSDHPGWGQVLKLTPDELKPGSEEHYDLDQVYEWAAGDPDPMHVSSLANVVDMVARIADCCDDGALRRLIEGTPAYADLVDSEVSYHGRDGKKRWNEVGDTVADSWERAIGRVESWLNWQGDYEAAAVEEEEDAELWGRVGAEPIEIVLRDATYLTVRGEVAVDPDSDETEVGFIGDDDEVKVFTEVANLAHYCRTATEHALVKLEWWGELAEEEDDEAFAPAVSYDLRKPSADGAELLRELAAFCGLDADTDVLDGPHIDWDDWRALVDEVVTCFEQGD
ncbi:MAG TPA: hypothetical protein VFU35_14780, partial [Jatrophihabitans sp.]|nr:hypothetical protein [Jatrophihabitans sp.]